MRELMVAGMAWERAGETLLRELRIAGMAWERAIGLAH